MTQPQPPKPRIFTLQAYGNRSSTHYVVITPPDTEPQKVTAAWSYAVRYTAKGIDLPDYEAAAALMMKRHPSWQLIVSGTQVINVDLTQADKDIPENA